MPFCRFAVLLFTLWNLDGGLDIRASDIGKRWTLVCLWIFAVGCGIADYRSGKGNGANLLEKIVYSL